MKASSWPNFLFCDPTCGHSFTTGSFADRLRSLTCNPGDKFSARLQAACSRSTNSLSRCRPQVHHVTAPTADCHLLPTTRMSYPFLLSRFPVPTMASHPPPFVQSKSGLYLHPCWDLRKEHWVENGPTSLGLRLFYGVLKLIQAFTRRVP